MARACFVGMDSHPLLEAARNLFVGVLEVEGMMRTVDVEIDPFQLA